MRWVLIFLGILTFALAVVLAHEGQWWIAVPDGAFGAGIAWIAWGDLHAPIEGAPVLRTAPVPPAPEPPPPSAAVMSPPPTSRPAPRPRASVPSAKKRRKGRR